MQETQKKSKISHILENYPGIFALALLMLMSLLSFATMIDDSAIVDEIAHIPAGYSYVTYSDYRLNPEHPPLLKDLAGLPLRLLDLKFPIDHPSWTRDVNGQWESGWHFLYHYGNNAGSILLYSRLPILFLAIIFGYAIYYYVKKRYGALPALLALFFYSLSPNFLAHNHFVTTDLGIAFFIFLSLVTFSNFLEKPNFKNLVWATLALAAAQLAKFSAVLLIPFYLAHLVILLFKKINIELKIPGSRLFKPGLLKKSYQIIIIYLSILCVMMGIIWIFYAPHTINFPSEKQIELIKVSLPNEKFAIVRNALIKLSENDFTKPLAQYALGVAMVFGRVAGGNTTYFIGEVSNQSFKWYFPVSYLLKTPIPLLFLLFLSVIYSLSKYFKPPIANLWIGVKKILQEDTYKAIFFTFILYYGGISIAGNLNLGIRHLFPILPLIDILVALGVIEFFSSFKTGLAKKLSGAFLGLLLFWYGVGTLVVFPNFLSYHNEIIGGSKNAYWYFTDSNIDWGQDLKRLKNWLYLHPEITKIKLDYFGGGEPKYYFCSRNYDESRGLIRNSSGYDCKNSVYQEWHSKNGFATGWIAVSATFLQNAKFYAERFNEPDYDWLRNRTPYANIGGSILVYWVR